MYLKTSCQWEVKNKIKIAIKQIKTFVGENIIKLPNT